MKKKKLTALVLSLALAVTGVATGISTNKVKAADYGLSNPRVDSAGNVIWDCAYFGSYYQTAEWTKEPIKWRVLSVDENNNAFIVADKNLDCKRYNKTCESVTWKTCTLRSWLNGYDADSNVESLDYSTDNFIDTAFTEEEQAAINSTRVINNDNPKYGTDGDNNTEDKIYLLSLEEASDVTYGFASIFDDESKTREVQHTDYARFNGAADNSVLTYGYAGIVSSWLRSPCDRGSASSVAGDNGQLLRECVLADHSLAVRPALHINLSCSSVWNDAGVTDSEGKDGASDGVINNPIVENGVTTWDCIYFGSYYQTAQWTKEPIKWRVLSIEGDDAFFVADKNLDCKLYNETNTSVTWETSSIRSWLNGYSAGSNIESIDYSTDNFIDEAFTEEEQAAIKTTTVINNNNPEYGTDGGNNTEDKVYLLSIEEASNLAYGFDIAFNELYEIKTRKVRNTDYAELRGAYYSCKFYGVENAYAYWWLRSPGLKSNYASCINSSGNNGGDGVFEGNVGKHIFGGTGGVRPALHINLSSSVWKAAGTVTSSVDVVEPGVEHTPSQVPTSEPTVAPSVTATPQETKKPSDTAEFTEYTTPTESTQIPVITQTPSTVIKPNKKIKISNVSAYEIRKNTFNIIGKVSVKKATVKIKIGNKRWNKATVKGKTFKFRTGKLKKSTKIRIEVSKKGYKTQKKVIKLNNVYQFVVVKKIL